MHHRASEAAYNSPRAAVRYYIARILRALVRIDPRVAGIRHVARAHSHFWHCSVGTRAEGEGW